MMGHRQVEQAALFYEFSLDKHIPADHLLRSIDRFVELGDVRRELRQFYSSSGRPSVDPELMIRMLIIGYCFGIRSERRLCEEVHLNLAYRWFCRLGLVGQVPDHSTFPQEPAWPLPPERSFAVRLRDGAAAPGSYFQKRQDYCAARQGMSSGFSTNNQPPTPSSPGNRANTDLS